MHDRHPDGGPPVPGLDPALAAALADELVALTGLLSELAYDLGGNPETLRRHMTSLQLVDRITQTQLAIAEVLRSAEPVAERLSAVTLESLAASLRDGYADRMSGAGAAPESDLAA